MKIYPLFYFAFMITVAFASQRFYIGSDYTYQDFQENVVEKVKAKKKAAFKSYKIGYDLEGAGLYLGGDYHHNNIKPKEKTKEEQYTSDSIFVNYEGRVGLGISFLRYLQTTVFIGMGHHDWTRKKLALEYDKIKYQWLYFCYGLRFWLFPHSSVCLGCHFKIMKIVTGKTTCYANEELLSTDTTEIDYHLKKKIQYLLEFPLRFYLRSFRPFDISLIPYISEYILDSEKSFTFFQHLLVKGENKTYDTGIRLEIGVNF